MVHRNISLTQPALFKRSLKEFLKETGVDINKLKQWFRIGWISFDPGTQKVYDDKEQYEAMFIKGLVKSELPKETITHMLSQLEKPYCYSYKDIYWDFDKNEWREFSQVIDEFVDNNLEEIIGNNLESYLGGLSENNKEELERIIDCVKNLLNKK